MKLMKGSRLALLAALAASCLVACGDDDEATCRSAMTHFYDQQCGIYVGGDLVSRADAINGCEENQLYSEQQGCASEFQRALDCMEGIGRDQCDDCDNILASWNICLGGGDPTCESALNNLYDQGCTMVDGYGDPISRPDAIYGCNETASEAQQAGCESYFEDVLECMEGIGQEQCTYCNPELEDLYTCME